MTEYPKTRTWRRSRSVEEVYKEGAEEVQQVGCEQDEDVGDDDDDDDKLSLYTVSGEETQSPGKLSPTIVDENEESSETHTHTVSGDYV